MFQYYPNDAQSEQFLKTIPIKVSKWLANLEQSYNLQLLNTTFKTGRLTVEIFSNGGTIILGEENDGDFTQLWWDGNFDDIHNVRTSNLTLVEAAIHLSDFVYLEKLIYFELQEFANKEELEQPSPRMPSHYERSEGLQASE